MPEEINRRIVDHAADINLTYSAIAREYLLREGIPPDTVIKTGSPMLEVLTHYKAKIDASDVLQRLGLTQFRFFMVSAHREENVDSPANIRQARQRAQPRSGEIRIPVDSVDSSADPKANRRSEDEVSQPSPSPKPLCFSDYVHLQTPRAR